MKSSFFFNVCVFCVCTGRRFWQSAPDRTASRHSASPLWWERDRSCRGFETTTGTVTFLIRHGHVIEHTTQLGKTLNKHSVPSSVSNSNGHSDKEFSSALADHLVIVCNLAFISGVSFVAP